MQVALSQTARLEQTLSPRMIQFYQMLQCPLQDLDGLISQELADNPALELIDEPLEDSLREVAPPLGDLAMLAGDDEDPIAGLPAPVRLQDHLRWHFMTLARTDEERRLGLRLIDEINDDGYFEGTIGGVAMALGAKVVEVERVLELVQRLDPPGIGASDLRECLEIQLRQLREQGRPQVVAERLVEECWIWFSRCQWSACARRLKISEAAVAAAADWLKSHCHPYPGRQFRLPWQQHLASPARAWPEVYLRRNPAPPPAFAAEVVESKRLALRIDRIYRRLDDEIRHRAATPTAESEHIQTCVQRARQFIRSLQQRRETVRRIAQAVANEQSDYLRQGSGALKPLTRLDIARQLDLHESTVGRAVAGKFVQLPSEEVIPLEQFFDSGRPARMALQELVDGEDSRHPLSDRVLAERLAEQGYDVARRTVAKYRQMLKIPPASQRK